MSLRAERIWLAVIVAFGVSIYLTTMQAGFTFDDTQTILNNPGVQLPFSLDLMFLRDFWGRRFQETIGTWRPIPTISYWVDWHVANGRPWPFHLTNLVAYGALLALANAFLKRWGAERLSAGARLVAVAAFAALVIHVDVVPSATGRAEIFAALFTLGSMLVAMPSQPPLVTWRIAASALLLAMAMLSKESTYPMALAIPWIVGRYHQRCGAISYRRVGALLATSLLVLAGMVAFRMGKLPFAKTSFDMHSDNPLLMMPWWKQKLGAAEVFTHYLEHTLTGLDLVPDYSYFAIGVLAGGPGVRTVLGMLLVVALLAVLILLHRSKPLASDAIVGFGAAYLVASHFVVPASALVADRLFFFPSFWLVVLGAVLLDALPRLGSAAPEQPRRIGVRRLAATAAIAWIAVQGIISAAAATMWRDNAVLYTQAIQTYPHVARTRVNFSLTLSAVGRDEDAAWHLLIAQAYYVHFPAPVPPDDFPLAWDDLPIEERVQTLRTRLGDPLMLAALQRALESCEKWRLPRQGRVLALWHGAIRSDQKPLPPAKP